MYMKLENFWEKKKVRKEELRFDNDSSFYFR